MHTHETPPAHRRAPVAADNGYPSHPPLAERLWQLQRAAGNAAVASAFADDEERSPVLDVVGRGGGAPLSGPLRTEMQSRLGADLGDVRIHSGSTAASSAASVQAHAYTVGHEIVLGAGREDLSSPAGRHTLAHELTHVLQQREGTVDGTPAPGGIAVSHPDDSFERAAEANASAVLADEPATD